MRPNLLNNFLISDLVTIFGIFEISNLLECSKLTWFRPNFLASPSAHFIYNFATAPGKKNTLWRAYIAKSASVID